MLESFDARTIQLGTPFLPLAVEGALSSIEVIFKLSCGSLDMHEVADASACALPNFELSTAGLTKVGYG